VDEYYFSSSPCEKTHCILDAKECKAAYDILGFPGISRRHNFGLKAYEKASVAHVDLEKRGGFDRQKLPYKGCFFFAVDIPLETQMHKYKLMLHIQPRKAHYPERAVTHWANYPLKLVLQTETTTCMDHWPWGYGLDANGMPKDMCYVRAQYEHMCKIPNSASGNNLGAEGPGYSTREYTFDCTSETGITHNQGMTSDAKCKSQKSSVLAYDDAACNGLGKPVKEDAKVVCGVQNMILGGAQSDGLPGCLPGSEGIILDTIPQRTVALKDLQVGDKVRVFPVEGEDQTAHLADKWTSAEVLGWGNLREKQTLTYLEINIGGRHVRLTPDHYVIAKKTLESGQQVLRAMELKLGYYLPFPGSSGVEWHPVTDSKNVDDKGAYVPLLSKAGNIVTRHGIILPLLSQGHDLRTSEATSDLTPAEAYTVYSSWVGHYASLKSKYPCLVTFDEDYKQTVVTEMMKQYFAKHNHDIKDAIDPDHFLEWLRSDPEAVVGSEYAPHLKQTCSDLFDASKAVKE